MLSRSNALFAGIFGFAIVATVLLFTVGTGLVDERPSSGKLSVDVINAEAEYKALQQEWLANEKDFREAKLPITPKLTGIQEKFRALEKKSATLKGLTPAEQDALPHFVGSIKASSRMVEPYVIRLMAPERIGPDHWAKKNRDAEEANAEWNAWLKATENMSR